MTLTKGWSQEEIDILTERASEGLTAKEIASLLPLKTRNAVIGKANRLGICFYHSRIKDKVPLKDRDAAKLANSRRQSYRTNYWQYVTPEPVIIDKHLRARADAIKNAAAQRLASNIKQAQEAKLSGIPLDLIESGECRWPLGDSRNMICCGQPVYYHQYCEIHYKASRLSS